MSTESNTLTNEEPKKPQTEKDQIEVFIESMIEKAKQRTMIANIAIVVFALFAISNASALPGWRAYLSPGLTEGLDQTGELAAMMRKAQFAGLFFLAEVILEAIAVTGLWKMRRFGVYASMAIPIAAFGAWAFAQYFSLISVAISGALAYFLWKEKEKYSRI